MSSGHFLLPFREQPRSRPISSIGLSLFSLISLIFLLVNPRLDEDIFYYRLIYVGIIYLIALIVLLCFRANLIKTLRVVFTAFIIVFFLGISSFFLHQGEIIYSIPIGNFTLNLYSTGVYRAVMIWVRGLFSVSIVTLYSTTITLQEFIQSLRSLFVPNIMVSLILLILRYTPMLYTQGQNVRIAQELRGLRSSPFKRRFSAAASRIGGTLIRSVRKGTEVYEGMVLRGLESSDFVRRTNTKWLDWIIVPIMIILYTILAGGLLYWLL